MLEEYFQLRKMGHTRREAYRRARRYSQLKFPLTGYHGVPEEVKLEKGLRSLENSIDSMNFQSQSDIEEMFLEAGKYPRTYITDSEYNLISLHQVYCRSRELLSGKQVEIYENILKQVPDKFRKLLGAIERNELKDHEIKREGALKKKQEEWKRLYGEK